MVETLVADEYFTSPDFPIAIVHVPSRLPVCNMHRHEFAELAIVFAGKAIHCTEQASYPIETGDIFFLRGQQVHGFRDIEALDIANLIFRPERLSIGWHYLRTLPGYHALFALEPSYRQQHAFLSRLHVDMEALADIAGLITQMQEELDRRDAGYEPIVLAHFSHLLVHLARCYSRMTTPIAQHVLRVAAAVSYIETNFPQAITLRELSDIAFMSPFTFLRVFKQAMGLSPIAYLINTRVRKAVDLLHESSHGITDIADAVGFTDSNYFARQFKAIMGISPRAYRQHLGILREPATASRLLKKHE
ncbi:MAG TPA: AraC family transcriptional regulator [Armatimonadota bacterium]|jgi:AraC family L-rhamnose operon transcriptional activator RhaR/AraC family L-rhamnose operon regulatory protein RhaS